MSRRTHRVAVKQTRDATNRWQSADSFTNFEARLGLSANNISEGSQYQFKFVSRNRIQLEAMYRTSWVVGQVVDVVADDMTRAGTNLKSTLPPDDIEKVNQAFENMALWDRINDTIKWSRLYGGAIAVMLIDGQKPETPLNLDSIGEGAFKGLYVLDRWMIQPSLTRLVTEFGPDLGMPMYYDIVADSMGLTRQRIHYSRVIRFDGVDLPYWQRIAENLWGQSVIERLFDRLVAFDSSTTGAAQLMYKAHLRTYSVEKLRELIAIGGKPLEALYKQIQMIRHYQSNEGMTLMDASDKFEAHTFSFAGIPEVIDKFGEQLSGAAAIPLTRLFGQSPKGLNSTGDNEIRNYYDNIKQQQERRLRRPITMLYDVLHRSVLGIEPPDGWSYTFNSLWQLSDTEKADIAQKTTTTVTQAHESGLITDSCALSELRQSSEITGIWSNITDENIESSSDELPPAPTGNDESNVTHDADFNESDHPRAENGEFGKAGTVEITEKHTDPLPTNITSAAEMKTVLHQELADKFGSENPVVNKATGSKMIFTRNGLNASLAKNGKSNEKERLLRSIYLALPEMFASAVPAKNHYEPNTKPEIKPGIAGYRNYVAKANVNGTEHNIRIGVDVPHPRVDGTLPRDGAYYFHKFEIEDQT